MLLLENTLPEQAQFARIEITPSNRKEKVLKTCW